MDFVRARRPAQVSLVAGRGHYDSVITAVLEAQFSVWIATANLKELMVEDPRAAPGKRRGGRRTSYRSVIEVFDELTGRGVELRLMHAGLPSGPFARTVRQHPRVYASMRTCPRLHFKAVVVDGALLYLGSANWTGAGLGAKGTGRRNFELGVVTDDTWLLDEVQGLYDRLWRGKECGACQLREVCGAPLDDLEAATSSPRRPPSSCRPRRSGRAAPT